MTGCASAMQLLPAAREHKPKPRPKAQKQAKSAAQQYQTAQETFQDGPARADSLPAEIERLEEEIATISEQVNQPDFYQSERSVTAAVEKELSQLQDKLNHCFQRREELESQYPEH